MADISNGMGSGEKNLRSEKHPLVLIWAHARLAGREKLQQSTFRTIKKTGK